MKKRFYILSLFTLISCGLFAQTPTNEWAKAIGNSGNDVGKDIVTDSNGNVYTVGYFNNILDVDPNAGINYFTPVGGLDIFITKLNANGELVWAKQIGGVSNEGAFGIALNQNNHLYITGYYTGSVDFDPSSTSSNMLNSVGGSDVFILKLDVDGNHIWSKSIGGNQDEYCEAIAVDAQENVYITGMFSGTCYFNPASTSNFQLTNLGSGSAFLAAYTSAGIPIYANGVGAPSGSPSSQAIGTAIHISYSGFAEITGYFSGTIDINPSSNTTDLRTSNGGTDIFVLKCAANGALLLGKTFGGPANDQGNGITGGTNDETTIIGDFFGTIDFNNDPLVTNYFSSNGTTDVFIHQMDINGDYVWTKTIGSSSIDQSNSIVTDQQNDVYLTGSFVGTLDADPSANIYSMTSISGGFDIFLLKLTSNGDFIWARSFSQISGPNNTNRSQAIHVDMNETIYTTGFFQGSIVDFSLNNSGYNLSSQGQGDVFISKITTTSFITYTCPADSNIYMSQNPPVMPDLTSLVTASTNCTLNNAVGITQNPVAGSTLVTGANTVTLTFLNDCGDAETCQVTVNYINDLSLTVQCPADQTTTDAVCPDYTSLATVTSVCPAAGVTTTQTPAAGSNLPMGATTITLETSNNCGLTSSCTFVVDRTLGINESNMTSLAVYPNPTKGFLTIESNRPTTLQLVSVQGQLLRSVQIDAKTTIDITNLSPGVYLLIGEGNNPIRFIKE